MKKEEIQEKIKALTKTIREVECGIREMSPNDLYNVRKIRETALQVIMEKAEDF